MPPNVFKKGHSLRLDRHRSTTNAENTVYHDKLRASYIELSILHSSEPHNEQIRSTKE